MSILAELEGVRLPPHSTPSEQAVIGAILVNEEAFDLIAGTLDTSHFWHSSHATIFGVIAGMYLQGKTVDVVTVAEELDAKGMLDTVGGLSALSEMAMSGGANVAAYARVVRENWQARKLMEAGNQIAELASSKKPVAESLNAAQTMLSDIAEVRTGHDPRPIADALPAFLNMVDEAFNRKDGLVGLPTGLTDLDRKLGGLKGGEVIVIAGRPGMGKTSLAMQIAHHCASDHSPALVLSMEMPAMQLVAREAARVARLSVEDVMAGRLDDLGWSKLTHAVSTLQQLPLIVDEEGALTMAAARAKARMARRKHGIGLLVVDYLQLMTGEGDTRDQEIGAISRGFKALAKEMNIPVILLSQLNRSLENRTNKRPQMSDLRESGAIEQDADVILFIYRDEVYDNNSFDKGVAEIIVGKRRMGSTGMVPVAWMGEYSAFGDMSGPMPSREYTKPKPPRRRGFDD